MWITPSSVASRGSVLIVEDEHTFAHDVVAVPFVEAWHLTFAYNIPQALTALEAIPRLDIALVDLNLPGGREFSPSGTGGGFDVIDRVQRRYPDCLVVVLTAYLDAKLVNAVARRRARYMVKDGVTSALAELAQMQPALGPAEVVTVSAFSAAISQRHSLTTRERDVLELLLSGLDRDGVAERLGTAASTVKSHIRGILGKTGAHRIGELRSDLRCASSRARQRQ